MTKQKTQFIPGLSEKPSQYEALSKYMDIVKVDWNNLDKLKLKSTTIVGFSFGAILACIHSLKHKVQTLVLCSMTEGVETLQNLKADNVIFLVGEKEKWCIREIKRVSKTLKCHYQIIIIPEADHQLKGDYEKRLLEVLRNLDQ